MEPTSAQLEDERAASQLCSKCGLCCNGMMFSQVNLKPQDNESRLREMLPLSKISGKTIFKQPCPAFRGDCCSIYDERPAICQGYRCKLLKTLDQKEIDLTTAQKEVDSVKTLEDRLHHELKDSEFHHPGSDEYTTFTTFRSSFQEALKVKNRAYFIRHQVIVLIWRKLQWTINKKFKGNRAP